MGDGAEEMLPDWEDDDRTEEIKSATLEEKYLKLLKFLKKNVKLLFT